MNYEKVAISDFCKTGSGGTPSRDNPEYYIGDIPWVKSGDLRENIITEVNEHISTEAIKNSSAKVVPKGAILLAMYGATVGRMALLGVDAATNQAVCNIIPDESKALTKYVYYALQDKVPELLLSAVGGAQPNINQSIIKSTKIFLPDLENQKRIAAILDKADAIRRKRQQAIQLADDFLRALFLDMFGDPVTNPKGWDVKTFTEIGKIDRGISKHRPRNDPILLDGKHPLIQTGDIANCNGYIRTYKATYSDAGLKQSKKWDTGTLCITIAANIAKTGILTFDACFPDSVVGFIPNKLSTTEYVQYWLSFLQSTLEASAPESAQKNINLAILKALLIPLPPIELQREFAKRVEKVEALKAKLKASAEQAELQFNALSQRAFAGEL